MTDKEKVERAIEIIEQMSPEEQQALLRWLNSIENLDDHFEKTMIPPGCGGPNDL
jgi:hypothetical protein